MLKRHEGTGPTKNGRFLPYKDTVGKLTIGYGHNLTDKGLTLRQAEALLDDDIDEAIRDLVARFPWVAQLDVVRQAVLVDMCFNLGIGGLAQFRQTLAAIQRGDYETASVRMLESLWADQVGRRARRLAEMMRSGQWGD